MFLDWFLQHNMKIYSALILMHHYWLSDFINNYSSVRSGIDHLDRGRLCKTTPKRAL